MRGLFYQFCGFVQRARKYREIHFESVVVYHTKEVKKEIFFLTYIIVQHVSVTYMYTLYNAIVKKSRERLVPLS